MDSSQNQPVPTKHVRYVFSSVVSLLTKVRNIPYLSAIHDNLRVMQVELKSTSEETALMLAKVKEGIQGNAAEMKKSITVGEEKKVLAKEAVEVGETTVSIIMEVKNKGTLSGSDAHMSYAAVAASGTLAASIHNPHSAKNLPNQTKRKITVNTRNPSTIQTLRAMNSRNLNAHIERAIWQSSNEQITGIRSCLPIS